jgi:hypothetical protein
MPARGRREPAQSADSALGHLAGPALDRVAGHVEHGPAGTTALPAFDGLMDSLWSQLRRPADPDAVSEPAVPQECLAPLLSLPKRGLAAGAAGRRRVGAPRQVRAARTAGGRLPDWKVRMAGLAAPAKPDTLRRIMFENPHPTCR